MGIAIQRQSLSDQDAGPGLTQTELGRRIAHARERAGLSQSELGERVELPQSAISRIESGARGVDSLELAAIAGTLGVSAVELLETDPVAEELRVAARAETVTDPSALEPILARVLDLARLHRLTATDAGAASDDANDEAMTAPPGSPVEAGRRLAEVVRSDWGLEDDPLPQSLLSLIEERSNLAVGLEPMHDRVAGLCARVGDFSLALVDSSAPYGRQRFTALHELCHYLLNDGDRLVVDETLGRKTNTEKRANAFAAYFLMPPDSIKRYLRDRDLGDDVIIELQYTFGVSLDALLWQLVNLGHITRHKRDQLMAIGAKALAFRHGYGSEWGQLEAERGGRRAPRPLQERAIRAYAHGSVGIEPLADLLGRRDLDSLRRELEDQGIAYEERWWEETAPA
jgi:Zn-dependent peptidase ImmA (M78 family)/DNA-binding XRE family transcriptional regulator